MKKRVSMVTFHYMLITAGFWMSYCFCTTDAAVYLQAVGYTNVQLGIILALANIGGAFLSTMIGDFLDSHPQIRHIQVLHVLCAVQMVMLALLRLNPVSGTLPSIFYVLYCTALMAVNAVNLDLCVRLEHLGADLNFGLSRAVGSLSFTAVSALMGILIARTSHLIILDGSMVMVVFQFAVNLLMDRDLKAAESSAGAAVKASSEKSATLTQFIRQNPAFSVMLIGITLVFTAHCMDNTFMINEVRALGGSTVELGWMAAFTAVVEIPVMVLASRLPKKWSHAQYIRLAFLFFVIKIFAYAMAPNMPLFFAARILQAPSYALYIVLIVPYADMVVPHKDSAKAQGLLVSVTNLGAVLASLIGGALFDSMGVRPTMLIATAIAAAGCAVGVMSTRDERKVKAL